MTGQNHGSLAGQGAGLDSRLHARGTPSAFPDDRAERSLVRGPGRTGLVAAPRSDRSADGVTDENA